MNLERVKDRYLKRIAFKNVSGNWQFTGDMTPERVFNILLEMLANDLPPENKKEIESKK